jgi:hypothetical protein
VFGGDDGLVFRPGYGELFFEVDGRPASFDQDGPRQPTHVHGEIVQSPEKYIG